MFKPINIKDVLATLAAGIPLADIASWIAKNTQTTNGDVPFAVALALTPEEDQTPEEWAAGLEGIPVRGSLADFRVVLATNTDNAETLSVLAGDPRQEVRVAAASNQHTRPEDLERLATDKVRAVVECVASNPNSPDHALLTIAAESTGMRQRIATNPGIGDTVAEVLLDYAEPHVIKSLIGNRSATLEWVLRALDHPATAPLAAAHRLMTAEHLLDIAEKAVATKDVKLQRAVLANVNTEFDILDVLAMGSRDFEILAAIAKHPLASDYALEILRESTSRSMQNALRFGDQIRAARLAKA